MEYRFPIFLPAAFGPGLGVYRNSLNVLFVWSVFLWLPGGPNRARVPKSSGVWKLVCFLAPIAWLFGLTNRNNFLSMEFPPHGPIPKSTLQHYPENTGRELQQLPFLYIVLSDALTNERIQHPSGW